MYVKKILSHSLKMKMSNNQIVVKANNTCRASDRGCLVNTLGGTKFGMGCNAIEDDMNDATW